MKIASLNICGLKIRTKIVSDFIYKNHLDLIAIQEVHKIEKFEIQKFEKDTKGTFFVNSNTLWAGTGILVRNNLQNLKIDHLEVNDPNLKDRVTHLQIHTKIYIYAPSVDGKKKPFYRSLNKYLANFNNNYTILMGDFNYVSHRSYRLNKLRACDSFWKK